MEKKSTSDRSKIPAIELIKKTLLNLKFFMKENNFKVGPMTDTDLEKIFKCSISLDRLKYLLIKDL